MRSSFYSMQSRDSDDANLLEQEQRCKLVEQLNIANIIELSHKER